jgi:hypothetical protein
MTTIFDPDLAAVAATTPVYKRGEYLLEITKSSPFAYPKDDEKTGESYIVAGNRFQFEMVGQLGRDGEVDESVEIAGQEVAPFSCFVHTRKAFSFTKRTLMAFMGFTKQQEDQANEEYFNSAELWINPGEDEDDEVTGGAGWSAPVGNRVVASLDIEQWDGDDRQQFRAFRPYTP